MSNCSCLAFLEKNTYKTEYYSNEKCTFDIQLLKTRKKNISFYPIDS